MTSTGRPPILRPTWSRPSSNEFRMSLPMAAPGPLNVLMKPILIVFCWAVAGDMASAIDAHAASSAVLILTPSQKRNRETQRAYSIGQGPDRTIDREQRDLLSQRSPRAR